MPRYTLHPLVRAFAGARLAEQTEFETRARERWVAWYTNLARHTAPADDYTLLRCELSNLISVARWLLSQDRAADLGELLCHSQRLIFAEGRWQALVDITEYVARWAESTGDPVMLGVVLRAYTDVATNQGRWADVDRWTERIDRVAASVDDARLQAQIKIAKARHGRNQRTLEDRATLASEALAIFRHYRDREGEVIAINALGNLHLVQKQFADATQLYEEGLRLLDMYPADIPQPKQWRATLCGNLGHVVGRQGHYAEARDILRSVLDDLKEQTDLAEAYAALALYELHLGNTEEACTQRQKADEIIERLYLERPLCAEDAEWMRLHGQTPSEDQDVRWYSGLGND